MAKFRPSKSSNLAPSWPQMSAPGPVRNVRVMVKAPKKRCGYGLYYSDSDEEDENLSDSKSQLQQQIVSQPSVASPTVISRPTTTTTATAKTSEKVPDYIVSTRRRKVSSSAVKQTNVSGAKTLMIERGSTNNAGKSMLSSKSVLSTKSMKCLFAFARFYFFFFNANCLL